MFIGNESKTIQNQKQTWKLNSCLWIKQLCILLLTATITDKIKPLCHVSRYFYLHSLFQYYIYGVWKKSCACTYDSCCKIPGWSLGHVFSINQCWISYSWARMTTVLEHRVAMIYRFMPKCMRESRQIKCPKREFKKSRIQSKFFPCILTTDYGGPERK